jgi:hypothetical protein
MGEKIITDRFRWGDLEEGDHFEELDIAWKKIFPALVLRPVALLQEWA